MNADYEASLLTLYLDKVAMGKLIRLGMRAEYLDSEDQVRAWQLAKDWYQDHGQAHAIRRDVLEAECEQYLKVMSEYMAPFAEEPMSPEYLVEKLQIAYLQREGRIVLEEKSQWMDDSLSINDAMSKYAEFVKAATRVLSHSTAEKPLSPMSEDVGAHVSRKLEEYDQWQDGVSPGSVTFGYQMVDDAYDGMRDQELTMVLAGTGVGKSYYLCKCAYSIARSGRPVALYTLENTVEMAYDRLLAIAGSLDVRQVEKGAFEGDSREAFRALAGDEVFNNLYVKQPRGMGRSLEAMYDEASAIGVHALLGDQFSHVEMPGKFDSDWQRFAEIARQAKQLSMDHGFPSVWAAQLNREGAKRKNPKLTDVGRAWMIANEADWAFIISPTDNNIVHKVTCQKHRRGMDRAWFWSFEFTPARFEMLRETSVDD